MQYPDLKEIEQRPRRYWTADGVPELMMGLLWVVWAIAFLFPGLFPAGRWLSFYWSIVPFILIGSGFASSRLTRKIKQRLTFPRTGYVEWPEPRVTHKVLPALFGAGTAAGMVFVVRWADGRSLETLVPPAMALLLALAFVVLSVRHGSLHFLWYSAASLVLALVFAWRNTGFHRSLPFIFLYLGALMALLGAIRLRAYMRRNPIPSEGEA